MFGFYLITRLDAINNFSWVVFGLAITVILITAILYCVFFYDDKERAAVTKILKGALPFAIIGALIGIATPSTKDAVIIYAADKTIQYVENHEDILETPDKLVKLTNAYLDELTARLEKHTESVHKEVHDK